MIRAVATLVLCCVASVQAVTRNRMGDPLAEQIKKTQMQADSMFEQFEGRNPQDYHVQTAFLAKKNAATSKQFQEHMNKLLAAQTENPHSGAKSTAETEHGDATTAYRTLKENCDKCKEGEEDYIAKLQIQISAHDSASKAFEALAQAQEHLKDSTTPPSATDPETARTNAKKALSDALGSECSLATTNIDSAGDAKQYVDVIAAKAADWKAVDDAAGVVVTKKGEYDGKKELADAADRDVATAKTTRDTKCVGMEGLASTYTPAPTPAPTVAPTSAPTGMPTSIPEAGPYPSSTQAVSSPHISFTIIHAPSEHYKSDSYHFDLCMNSDCGWLARNIPGPGRSTAVPDSLNEYAIYDLGQTCTINNLALRPTNSGWAYAYQTFTFQYSTSDVNSELAWSDAQTTQAGTGCVATNVNDCPWRNELHHYPVGQAARYLRIDWLTWASSGAGASYIGIEGTCP